MSRNGQMLFGAIVVALACWAWRAAHPSASAAVAQTTAQLKPYKDGNAEPWKDYTPLPAQPVQYEQPQPIGQQGPSASDIQFQANARAHEQANATRDVARAVDDLRRQQEEQALLHEQ